MTHFLGQIMYLFYKYNYHGQFVLRLIFVVTFTYLIDNHFKPTFILQNVGQRNDKEKYIRCYE